MLLPLLAITLLGVSTAWAAPTVSESSVLKIPITDIVSRDTSSHEFHPNFNTYKRWLDTPGPATHFKKNPAGIFARYPNLVSIDCHDSDSKCFFTSRMMDANITATQGDFERALDPLGIRNEVEGDSDNISRRWLSNPSTLYTDNHLKTYHTVPSQSRNAGFEHYVTWNLAVC
jgi:hypothetical protein